MSSLPFLFSPSTLSFLSLLFALALGLSLLYLVWSFHTCFTRSPKPFTSRYGKTAIITGATDGIGLAIAEELVRHHDMDVVLVARSHERLESSASHLRSVRANVVVKVVSVDFEHFDEEAQQKVRQICRENEVGVLVNNVGASYPHPEFFHELPLEQVRSLLKLNIESTTFMTHLVLPFMAKQKRGCIINISSFSALVPAPLLAEYGAAKAYINAFSEALSIEYASFNIDVQAQCPLYVTSKLSKIRHPSFMTPSPRTYARWAVPKFGFEAISNPYWPHALQGYVLTWMPRFLVGWIVESQHLAIRSKALKKAEQNKKQ